jgi:putative flippase GtrA
VSGSASILWDGQCDPVLGASDLASPRADATPKADPAPPCSAFIYPVLVASGEQMTVEAGTEQEREVVRSCDHLDESVGRGRAWPELRRQALRFALVGGFVAGVYVGTTTFLAEVIGLPFEVSLAIGFTLAIVTHFSLQRLYVWRRAAAFALALHHQLARYLAMAALQYGATAAITATLPHALGVSPEVVYLPTVAVITVVNFLIFRSRIFHAALDPLQK